MADLSKGLYEQLISQALDDAIRLLGRDGLTAAREPLDPADSHELLTRHVSGVLRRVLRGLPEKNRIQEQVEICNALLQVLREKHVEAAPPGERVPSPAEALLSILQARATPAGDADVVCARLSRCPRPTSSSTPAASRPSPTRWRTRSRPPIASTCSAPSSAGTACACCWTPLAAHCRAGKPLRVITTVYTGSTERKALDWLVALGAQVKVSYDTQSTRLHAKAWLFRRDTGYSTAYIGSSNLSKSALVDGVEWNVRLSQVGVAGHPREVRRHVRQLLGRARNTRPTTRPGTRDRFDRAVAPQRGESLRRAALLPGRRARGRTSARCSRSWTPSASGTTAGKNLVVAATGTGKTIVAALDYKRLRDAARRILRLLFVAHRQEILRQSLGAFRQVCGRVDFGELYVDGDGPTSGGTCSRPSSRWHRWTSSGSIRTRSTS